MIDIKVKAVKSHGFKFDISGLQAWRIFSLMEKPPKEDWRHSYEGEKYTIHLPGIDVSVWDRGRGFMTTSGDLGGYVGISYSHGVCRLGTPATNLSLKLIRAYKILYALENGNTSYMTPRDLEDFKEWERWLKNDKKE